jgi:hypothetical protein
MGEHGAADSIRVAAVSESSAASAEATKWGAPSEHGGGGGARPSKGLGHHTWQRHRRRSCNTLKIRPTKIKVPKIWAFKNFLNKIASCRFCSIILLDFDFGVYKSRIMDN